jgi:bZIP factor
VKEHNGDRGWVPSWFIGKIGSSGAGVPPTPAAHITSSMSGGGGGSGGSGGGGTAIMSDSDLRYALDGPAASPVSPGFTGSQQTSGNSRGMI